MPIISKYAQSKKLQYFIDTIPKNADVLEVGCGSGWVSAYMKKNGWINYTGLDLIAPADIVGDIKNWKELGLKPKSFDYIIVFEVLEHDDIVDACYNLLKDKGKLLVTTPVPHFDWVLKIFEFLKLNQKRTSPHSNLLYVKEIKRFEPKEMKNVAYLCQWAILEKE